MTSARTTNLVSWTICCAVAGLIFLIYSDFGFSREVIMPLDDAYIHFQYARQLATGDPYVYNPGEAPTSGATSFLYPYVLAVGYLLGFQGLDLGWWAMGIGALALLASIWLVFLLVRQFTTVFLALAFALIFALNGAIAWHFMSGMETGLVIALLLTTLYTFVMAHLRGFVITATLLALSRPEAGVLALIAIGLWVVRKYPFKNGWRRLRWLALPVMAFAVQPVMNFLLTGSFSATGNQAKSILAMVPFDLQVVVERILDNFTRMWGELALSGDYAPFLIPLLALVGWLALVIRREKRYTAVLLLLWFLALTGALSTLDTAFWHFKRYQMPLFALMFVLAGWGLMFATKWLSSHSARRAVQAIAAIALLITVLPLFGEFVRLYRVNVENIQAQPLPMARWLAQNTPEDAVIAVHDVGMMRYVGDRHTLDMVGLTTPDAANYWRNGPGAVAEFLMEHQPDYVAAYTTARGLNYLAETSIYGELLAGFQADYDPVDNVALGAEFQGIFRPSWEFVTYDYPLQGSLMWVFEQRNPIAPPFVVDAVNIADPESESDHDYRWQSDVPGFVTETYQFDYADCPTLNQQLLADHNRCAVVDGGRLITGSETFTLRLDPTYGAAVLVTRLHPAARGAFDVYVNDQHIARRWIPEMPGRWLEVATYIPAEYITPQTRIRIEPQGTTYMPYFHWGLQNVGDLWRIWMADSPLATFQDGALTLMTLAHDHDAQTLMLDLLWQTDGTAQGDYKLFVHLYDDVSAPPVAQVDTYPAMMPVGNWLPGVLSDRIMVDLSNLSPGEYQLALGFYETATFERLMPEILHPNVGVDDGRLFVAGEVVVP